MTRAGIITRAVLLVCACIVGACSALANDQGAPTAADITARIKAINERPADAGMDGATTVEVKSVQIGTPRDWNVLDGGDGRKGTKLWPAKVHWLLRTHYRARTVVYDRQFIFSVFKNGFNEWTVSVSSEPGQSSKIYEEPSTIK